MKPTTPEPRQRGANRALPPDFDAHLSREEITLAEFPITTMAQRRPLVNELQIDEHVGFDEGGKPIRRAWLVVGSDKYGLPIAGDEDIYVAIVKMLEHRKFEQRLIPCTRYQICQVLGVKPDGKTYDRIVEAFTRFKNTSFVAENVFRDPDTGALVKREAFGIIDAFRFVDRVPRGTTGQKQPELPLSYLRVSDEFLQRLRQGKLKRLDIDFWRSLSSFLVKRVYRFLDKNRYRKPEYEIGVLKLAQRLGLAGSNPVKELKRILKRPCDELKERGFLEAYEYRIGRDGLKLWFRFKALNELERAERPQEAPAPPRVVSRPSRATTARNSAIPETGPAADLVAYFHELFHGAARVRPTTAELAKAGNLLSRCGGDVERAKACIDWIRKEARQTSFAIQSFGALLSNGYPERYEAMRVADQEARRRTEERDQAQALQLAYELWCDEESKRLFDALPEDEQERLVEAQAQGLDAEFGHKLDRFAWTPERRREWSHRRAVSTYAKGRLLAPQEWLKQRNEWSAEPTPTA